jgi:hypothetical protein
MHQRRSLARHQSRPYIRAAPDMQRLMWREPQDPRSMRDSTNRRDSLMVPLRNTPIRALRFALLLGLAAPFATRPAPASAQEAAAARTQPLPTRLSDVEFWKLVSDISEPGGYFQITDNFTSNEMEIGRLVTMLHDARVSGGVYMGVGPEQNLTYIAAIHPEMAFVVDIRRQAVMQHLMFKAVFELAKDRADFISILFSKPRPAGIDSTTPIQKIWEAFWTVDTDSAAGTKNRDLITSRLTKTHGFTFTSDESRQLRLVIDAFYEYGPSISTRVGQGGRGGNSGGFADMTGYSYDAAGKPQSFLSTEENYRYVKALEEKNLVVPVSGDFGGPKAIRAIGAWLKDHNATVSAFYVSNVEQYLFQDGHDRLFYENVATLPVNEASVFIRPYSMRRGGGGPVESLCPIAAFIRAAQAGRVYSNNAALACTR